MSISNLNVCKIILTEIGFDVILTTRIANHSQIGVIILESYSTKQRQLLQNFLCKNAKSQFTVEEISKILELKKISKSAIYRNINLMAEEGIVERFVVEGSRTMLYQYIGKQECNAHMHLKCSLCNQIVHTDHNITKAISEAANAVGFKVDRRKTIIFGVCSACNQDSK